MGRFGRPLFFRAERVPDHNAPAQRTGNDWRNQPPRLLLPAGVADSPRVAAFLGTVSLLMLLGWVTDVTWGGIAASLLFFRNIRGRGESIGHMWSLSIEAQFYLVWPWVLSRLDQRRAFIGSTCLIVGCWIWRTYAIIAKLYSYEGGKFYIRTDFRIDSILIGCWIAVAWSDPRVRERMTSVARHFYPLLFLPALGVWSFYAERFVFLRPVFLTLQTVLASVVFLWLLSESDDSVTTRLLSQPMIVWFGRLSYSLYLWQQIFLVTQTPLWGAVRRVPLNLVLTLAVASVSYYGIEKRFLRLKRRYETSN